MNAEQRERYKLVGKTAFIQQEMTRLGFWPPSPEIAEKAAEAEAQLKAFYEELAVLRTDLSKVELEISEIGDVPRLLAEIRRKRIERVRTERAARKVELEKQRAEKREGDRAWRQKTLPFLGRGVSAGLVYDGGDVAKVESLGLPALAGASDVAVAIGVEERELAWLTYHRGAATIDHYHRFTIPKRRGGTRVISSPKSRLRVAQGWLLRTILEPLPVHEAAMAFRPGRSVKDNAAQHIGRAVVARIDLKDFFPSINLRRVKKLFQSFGYNEGVATILALIATEAPRVAAMLDGARRFIALGERSLPQGACISPAITNLLCRRMDARLTGAARRLGFAYTRYADDLVFSHAEVNAPVGMLLALVRQIIADERFVINEEKTAVLRPQHRQVVTGVVVNNEAPRISRQDLRRFRAFLHQCDKFGADEMSRRLGKDAQAYASGYLAFVHMVSPEQEAKITQQHPWLSRWRRTEGAD